MREAHCVASAGHLGIEKTYDREAREYYWQGAYNDVFDFVWSCQECQEYKVPQTDPPGMLRKRTVERSWSVVACDLMKFPSSSSQNKCLVVFQDLFTRWVEVKSIRTMSAKNVAAAFEELILFRWKAPEIVISDNGKCFDNDYFRETLHEYGLTHVTTPPYHPQANPVERANRFFKTMIATYVGSNHRHWDRHLHESRHGFNTAVHSSTKVSPAFLNYRRPVQSLRREVEKSPTKWRLDPEVWVDRLKRLDTLRDLVAQ